MQCLLKILAKGYGAKKDREPKTHECIGWLAVVEGIHPQLVVD
jgi:hypothetical protein